jgi:uncharacterized protein
MKRLYEQLLLDHFSKFQQMAFLTGPRQVGKTSIADVCQSSFKYFKYLNWDDAADREIIISNIDSVLDSFELSIANNQKPLLIFDEIHKYKDWKNYLKGFIDKYKKTINILVTGSAKLDIYKKGGDSLMGRYFLYRAHPLSVAELIRVNLATTPLSEPKKISDNKFNALFEFGGFPEPFLQQNKSFSIRWQRLRFHQLFKEEIREVSQIQEIAQMELLANLLKNQIGAQTKFSELAKKARIADTTCRRWIHELESFYFCFSVKPWHKNITRSLIKEPKYYLWDWSLVSDYGAKCENFVASHLLKAVHFWSDFGLGDYDLYYLRDKDKNEVDFLITQNGDPWMLLEVKASSKSSLNKNLLYFQKQLKVKHVLQLAMDLEYGDYDCFSFTEPKIVSMKTFLSQLI